MKMILNAELLENVDRQQWAQFVNLHPHGRVFQTPFFYKSVHESGEWQPLGICLKDEQDKIIGLLCAYLQREGDGIRGKMSSRSVIFGGPLVKEEQSIIYIKLIKAYEEKIKKKAIYTQFRNLRDLSDHKKTFSTLGYQYKEHLNIHVDLTKTEDELWKEVHSKRKNEIRRARREGVTFLVEDSSEALDACRKILEEVYSRARLPYPSHGFFHSLHRNSSDRQGLRIFTARREGKIIGCMLGLVYRETIYDFYAGSLRRYYRYYPNDLIPWEVFLWGKRHGYQVFDFGGAGKPDVPYGVRDYKKKFGGEFVNFGRFQKIHKPVLMGIARKGFKIWQKIQRPK